MLTAIIPARYGSKRIKKKNIKTFIDKPILYYSIKAAKKSKLFKRIIVSTDSDAIRKIAISNGAECPFVRPKNLSGDEIGTAPVLQHAVKTLKLEDDFFCCIYATAPLLNFKDLIRSYNLIKNSKYNSCYSITNFSFPLQRAVTKQSNNVVKFKWKKNANISSTKHDAGMFYWLRTKEFKKQKTLYPTKSIGYDLSDDKVQDIDTLSDWKIAEAKYKYLKFAK